MPCAESYIMHYVYQLGLCAKSTTYKSCTMYHSNGSIHDSIFNIVCPWQFNQCEWQALKLTFFVRWTTHLLTKQIINFSTPPKNTQVIQCTCNCLYASLYHSVDDNTRFLLLFALQLHICSQWRPALCMELLTPQVCKLH